MAALRLRYVLPAILLAACVADGVTRAMPMTTWTFRAWEGLMANRQPATPFEPMGRFDSAKTFGDLANMGNLPWMRVFRHETFTIDAYGFRNPSGRAESGTVSVLLLGDSFAAGSGVADALTLGGQLTSAWGLETYTLAPILPSLPALASFTGMLQMKPGAWVVHPQTNLYSEAQAWSASPVRYPASTPLQRFRQSMRSEVPPMRILVNQMWKSLQNDGWLENPFRSAVHRQRLHNGDDLLFIAGESAPPTVAPETARQIATQVQYAAKLDAEASRLGLRYLAVLVPVKTGAYQHLFDVPGVTPVPYGMIAETERQMRAAGIRVLNLFGPLTERATALLPRHQFVYWRDDTHWSPSGIGAAAEAIAAVVATEGGRAR